MMLVVTASPWLAVRTDVMPAAFGASFPANDPVQADWAASGLMRDGRVCGIMSSPHGGVPMLSRIQALGPCLIVLTLLLFAGSAAAQDVSPRCEAAMDRAAGHYSKCLLSADASHARHKNATKLANRQARCETRFDRRTSRAIHRHGADACPGAGLVDSIAGRSVSYAQGVALDAAGDPHPEFLFVQNADGATLADSTLTLTGVNPLTGYFTDRPARASGQDATENFITLWEKHADDFVSDPPNADLSCMANGEMVNLFVELTDPNFDGTNLSYAVSGVGNELPTDEVVCDSPAVLFIDGDSGNCDSDEDRYNACPCTSDEQCGSAYCCGGPREVTEYGISATFPTICPLGLGRICEATNMIEYGFQTGPGLVSPLVD